MRLARKHVTLFLSLVLTFPVVAQQATSSPIHQDPQAVSVINQALAAAGGATALSAITDYTATGDITFHFAQDVQGTVTVRGKVLDQIRVDASLPGGVRSEIISQGDLTLKTEDNAVGQMAGPAPMAPARLILPWLLLVPVINNPSYKISYQGLFNLDGHTAHKIEVQYVQAGMPTRQRLANYHTFEVVIDASTLQILMLGDTVSRYLNRRIQYSDYRFASGVLVPFSIDEHIEDRPTRLIQLGSVTFNSGLQDSDFIL